MSYARNSVIDVAMPNEQNSSEAGVVTPTERGVLGCLSRRHHSRDFHQRSVKLGGALTATSLSIIGQGSQGRVVP